ncbi:MAG: hypothetical protein FJW66_04905, partial [Actinobacteria bacterium]|nr:hypothetical protein [Actinomycetota bacterium]
MTDKGLHKGKKSTKKIIMYILAGIFSAAAVAVAVLGVRTYFQYEAIYAQTRALLEAQERYDRQNFADEEFNYLEIPLKKEVKPGQTVTFNVHYK